MAIVRAQEDASSSSCAYAHDVFLSFRGEDTRKNFTDHLYTALVQAGFCTFRDEDEIERGESLKPELYKAIKGSRISIIVFSKDYASSPWCLDELVVILKCKRRNSSGHVVLPVFYDVHPSEIQKQKGRTGEAFDRYVKQYEAEINYEKKMKLRRKLKGWKEALEEVADLAGMELKNQANGHEAEFIKKIINVIRDKLRRTPLFVAPILIGMHSRAKNISKWLQEDSYEVSLLGICGMGGIGKTTIAKFIYDENYESFDGSCFLANVRELSRKPTGFVGLQRQLTSSILNKKHEKIYNVDEGIIKIKKVVSCRRVLLVLDDVDQSDQLHALCGMQEWFYPGSKIIITTRHERLLKPHKIHKVQELGHDESIKLFSFYAFGEDYPIEDYTEHTKRVVQLCGGLPLALQVIGSSLCGRTVPQWASEMKKLEAIPNRKILDKLKISYDCLQDDCDKRLFLDIACFFVGNDKDYTVKVLESTDTFADVGIQNLIDRHLLRIDSCNNLMMHQLVRDMGRNIVHQESPDEPGERSRLWHHEDAYGVLENETVLRSLKILNLSYSERLARTPNFSGIRKLERLILKGYAKLIEICESIEFLQELDLLDLKDCKNLRKLPGNMHKLGSLGTLIVSGCSALFASGRDITASSTANGQGKWWHTSLLLPWVPLPSRVPKIIWASLPKSLISLRLSNCNLSDDSLPCAFSNLSSLKNLDLSRNSFYSLPDCIKSLSSLQWLSLSFCSSLDSILGLPGNLQSLNLHNCTSIQKIIFQSTPHQLDEINTYNCYRVVEIEGILKREPIENVNRRIIKKLGVEIESIKNLKVNRVAQLYGMEPNPIPIEGIYEFGIFSTFIPGGEIPSCFDERKKGSSMSFIVSSVPKFRIQCLNICFVYARSGRVIMYYPFGIKINNKTKDLTWVYCPMYYGCPERDKYMTWLSQWNFGNELEGGDEIVISVLMGDELEVKECGIKIVYEEDNGIVEDDNYHNNKAYFHWNEVVGGDLSQLQLSTGTYFLYRKLYRDGYDFNDVYLDSYLNALEDIANFKEIQERKVRCGFVGLY